MREPYFTSDTIDDVSTGMLDEFEKRFGVRHKNFETNNAALIVLDMQKYFLDESSHAFIPSAAAIVERICHLADIFFENDSPVIFTRHIDDPDKSGPMFRWWNKILSRDNHHSELIESIDNIRGIIVEKSQYDAFYSTDLENILSENGVRQLVITGVMTHLCCESTARSAFMHGYDVFLCVDGTATYNEDFHNAALLNLSHGFATPILVKDILNSFER